MQDKATAGKQWAGNTFGTGFMHRSLVGMLRHSDVRLYYAFAAILVVPFCLVFSPGARWAYRYFRRRQGYGRLRSLLMTYKNHVLFSQVVIDKFALYAGKRMALRVEGYDVFKRLAAQPEGFVMLSAHVGCYEMAGYELTSDSKPFNALVFAGEKASVMQGRQRLFSANNIRMIPVGSGMSHLFEIDRALSQGEIVSLPADRVFGSSKTITVSLLGAPAQLPAGPFTVAAMRGLSVIAVNVMKTSLRGYTAYVSELDYDRQAPRRQQLRQIADAYAAQLDRMLGLYPCQWYNYYDFWTCPSTPSTPPAKS